MRIELGRRVALRVIDVETLEGSLRTVPMKCDDPESGSIFSLANNPKISVRGGDEPPRRVG